MAIDGPTKSGLSPEQQVAMFLLEGGTFWYAHAGDCGVFAIEPGKTSIDMCQHSRAATAEAAVVAYYEIFEIGERGNLEKNIK